MTTPTQSGAEGATPSESVMRTANIIAERIWDQCGTRPDERWIVAFIQPLLANPSEDSANMNWLCEHSSLVSHAMPYRVEWNGDLRKRLTAYRTILGDAEFRFHDEIDGRDALAAALARAEKAEKLRFGADADRRQLRHELAQARQDSSRLAGLLEDFCQAFLDPNNVRSQQRQLAVHERAEIILSDYNARAATAAEKETA